MISRAVGKHHVVLIQSVEGIHNLTVPALYIQEGNKTILFNTLIDYFIHFYSKSLNWKRKTSRCIGLFFDFCTAYKETYPSSNILKKKRDVIRKFAIAYQNGTIDTKTGEDPLGLYWPPAGLQTTKRLLSALTMFIEWCEAEGVIQPGTMRNVSTLDQRSTLHLLRAAQHVKDKSMLSHITTKGQIAKSLAAKDAANFIFLEKVPGGHTKSAENKAFPSELIEPLLMYGFVNEDGTEDTTAKMFTLLLMFGALRVSEPCHLWFNDIAPQKDGTCIVQVRHPSDAQTFLDGEGKKTRKQYLAERGLLPRNEDDSNNSYHAGWKDLKLDGTKSALVWFILKEAEILFREMYFPYLRYREGLMKIRREKGLTDHPFFFVKRNHGEQGEPYSINAYNKSLTRALNRLEKKLDIVIPRGKYSGTGAHGMRHFSGYKLSEADVNPKVIQNVLHHKSAYSQRVYTEPRMAKITKELNEARIKISSGDLGSIAFHHMNLG